MDYQELRLIDYSKHYVQLHLSAITENKMQQVAMKDPLYIYQERIRQATLKRVILEKELKILQGR